MSAFFYLISYLVSAVLYYHRHVALTGKTSVVGLLISALGYVLLCAYFQIRDHLDPAAPAGMAVMLVIAISVVLVIAKINTTPQKQADYDAFEKEQEELDNSVYSKLDPDSSWTSPERTRLRELRRQQKVKLSPGFYAFFIGLIVFNLCAATYFQTNRPHEATVFTIDAPLATEADLPNLASKGKLIKCELYTDKQPIKGDKKIAFVRIYERTSSAHPDGTHYKWNCIEQSPEYLTLYTSDRKTQVTILNDDLDRYFLKRYYDDLGKNRSKAPLPKNLLKLMVNDKEKYLVKGLPCGQRLTCIGRIEQDDNSIWLRPFEFKGVEHGVITSTMMVDELTTFLKNHKTHASDLSDAREFANPDAVDRAFESDPDVDSITK